jgi:hypothetical protein
MMWVWIVPSLLCTYVDQTEGKTRWRGRDGKARQMAMMPVFQLLKTFVQRELWYSSVRFIIRYDSTLVTRAQQIIE